MPNHVHLIMRPLQPTTDPLEKILQSRKLRSSREINTALGESGTLWQEESFDRIIRDEEHLYRCLQYIGDNPRRAGLSPDNSYRWVRSSWKDLGWDFEN
jgi:REP element-mobilizing transposase RayT